MKVDRLIKDTLQYTDRKKIDYNKWKVADLKEVI